MKKSVKNSFRIISVILSICTMGADPYEAIEACWAAM